MVMVKELYFQNSRILKIVNNPKTECSNTNFEVWGEKMYIDVPPKKDKYPKPKPLDENLRIFRRFYFENLSTKRLFSPKFFTIHSQFAPVFVTNYTFYSVHYWKYSFVTHQLDYIPLFQWKAAFFDFEFDNYKFYLSWIIRDLFLNNLK